jgi:hypothetical protein
MTKNEFKEIVNILEKKVGDTMPNHIRDKYWDEFGDKDFESTKQLLSENKFNSDRKVEIVIEGASEELSNEVNQLLDILISTEVGAYALTALEKFLAHKNKEEWAKEKKKYFIENNFKSLSLN